MTDAQLGPEEDEELRRLHMLTGFGMVAGSISQRYDALRGRDRRRAVRDPNETSLATPIEKKAWGDAPASNTPASIATAVASTAQRLGSAPQRVVGDTREVLGKRPEPRRGLGLFRR